MTENEVLTIRFVKGLTKGANGVAFCCSWINEIHVDETFKDSPALPDILSHERRHHDFWKKSLATNMCFSGAVKRMLILFWEFLWDHLDCWRIQLKHYHTFRNYVLFNISLPLSLVAVFICLCVFD